jgi:hypothetical protein
MKFESTKKDLRRRTVWNYLHTATLDRSREVVLYLAGEGDFDRAHGLRRGFIDENLIAVESDAEIVRALRARGVNVIPRPLLEVVAMWPAEVHVAGLLADLQCGLEVSVLQLLMLWQRHPAFACSMIYVNLQRGREHNDVVLQLCEQAQSSMKEIRALTNGAASERHRGVAASRWLLASNLLAMCNTLGRLPTDAEAKPWVHTTTRILPPYRSSRVVMDGVCLFNRPGQHSAEATQIFIERMKGGASLTGATMARAFDATDLARTRRCISAALAVRTARLGVESNHARARLGRACS